MKHLISDGGGACDEARRGEAGRGGACHGVAWRGVMWGLTCLAKAGCRTRNTKRATIGRKK